MVMHLNCLEFVAFTFQTLLQFASPMSRIPLRACLSLFLYFYDVVFFKLRGFFWYRSYISCFWGELEYAEWFPGARLAANKAYAFDHISPETSGA